MYESLVVTTRFGTFTATPSEDPNSPGIIVTYTPKHPSSDPRKTNQVITRTLQDIDPTKDCSPLYVQTVNDLGRRGELVLGLDELPKEGERTC